MSTEKYLEQVFGQKIKIQKYSRLKKLPLYLINEYEFFECEIQGMPCILLKMLTERILIEKIYKHLTKIKEIDLARTILVFDDLRSTQRRNLVINRIAFIVPARQIYLPFICLDFNETIKLKQSNIEKFTAGMQSIYLYIINQESEEVSTRELTEKLNISVASANRAIRQLVALGVVEESGNSTRKKYKRISKEEFWERGKKHLINPIQKVIYLSEMPKNLKIFFAYESALSKMSMINEPENVTYAIDKKSFDGINKKSIVQEYDLDMKKYYKVEVWKYNPELFAKNKIIDVFSLYAEYMEHNDPRIDIELDVVLKEVLYKD